VLQVGRGRRKCRCHGSREAQLLTTDWVRRRDCVGDDSVVAHDGNVATDRRRSLPSRAETHSDTTDEDADGDKQRKWTPVGPS